MFKLEAQLGSKRGIYCGSDGLYLGLVALIEHRNGMYALRSKAEIEALLVGAYGPDYSVAGRVSELHRIAAQLQRGELAQAMISALGLRLDELSEDGVAGLIAADAFLKTNFNPDQPRDWHGRWTAARNPTDTPAGTSDHPALVPTQELLPFGARPPLFFEEPPKTFRPFKEPVPRLSGREGSKDIPSWARRKRPYVGENGRDYAKRLMDERYGPDNWKQTHGREYNHLKKFGDRNFRDPLSILAPDDQI